MGTKLRNNQDGIAHIVFVVLVVVVIGAVGFAGWRVMANKKTNNTSSSNNSQSNNQNSTSSSSALSSCMAAYHDSDLCHFEQVSANTPIDKTAYKATLTATQNGTTSTLTYEQDGKGNTSLSTSGGGTQLNTIQYGGSMYMQNGSMWMKYPSGSAPAQTDNPNSNLSFLSSLNSVKFTKVGTVGCDNLTCLKYQVTDTAMPNSTQYVWFDTQSYKPRGYSASSTTDGTIQMTISYPSVTIAAPSPVQDYSTGQ